MTRYAALTDLEDIQRKMNREQRQLYTMDSAVFTVFLAISVFGALIASTVICAQQITVESKRVRREALAAKARRLRYAKDDTEVPAPPMATEGGYHIFLSHVWGTGQDQSNPCRASNHGPAPCFSRRSLVPRSSPRIDRHSGCRRTRSSSSIGTTAPSAST